MTAARDAPRSRAASSSAAQNSASSASDVEGPARTTDRLRRTFTSSGFALGVVQPVKPRGLFGAVGGFLRSSAAELDPVLARRAQLGVALPRLAGAVEIDDVGHAGTLTEHRPDSRAREGWS